MADLLWALDTKSCRIGAGAVVQGSVRAGGESPLAEEENWMRLHYPVGADGSCNSGSRWLFHFLFCKTMLSALRILEHIFKLDQAHWSYSVQSGDT